MKVFWTEGGEKLSQTIEDNFDQTLQLLNAKDLHSVSFEKISTDYYNEKEREPLAELPRELAVNCSLFLEGKVNEDIVELLIERYRLTNREKLTDYLFNLYSVQVEAAYYSYPDFVTEKCRVINFQTYHHNKLFGSVSLFINNTQSYAMFQGITKSFEASLIGLLAPELWSIKLNTVLLSKVENYLKNHTTLNRVYVKPLSKQRNILMKHYGYLAETNPRKFVIPNPEIWGSTDSTPPLYKDLNR
jgi:hypothetical protein